MNLNLIASPNPKPNIKNSVINKIKLLMNDDANPSQEYYSPH